MASGVSAPFIRRPVATTLLMIGVFLVGLAAYPLLPVAPLPQIDFPTIQVSASLPGASPETMASTVAQPLERQFSQIAGVAQMTSISVAGSTQVVVQFELDRSIDAASLDVQAGINNAGGQLPKNLPNPPIFRKVNPADSPILILAVQSDALPLTEVDDYADNILSQQISQISGVSQVSIGGEQKPAVRIQVDPARLASMNMTLEDVRQLLVTATVDGPKGVIDGPTRALSVYANDQITKAKDFDNLILAWRNGAPVRVRDIGRAVDGPENARVAGWQNGKRGIQLFVFKQPGANVIDTVERVKAAMPALRAAIPPSVSVENIYRHIEEGMSPTEAALKGAGEIGFTIVSISLSLIAVFIPLLLMGGIVGRLFREFAMTVAITVVVSAVVSLTLTPMMCSRFLKDPKQVKHGTLYMAFERFFDGLLRFY